MKNLRDAFLQPKKVMLLVFIAALALAWLGAMLVFANHYGFYNARRAAYALVALPFLFVGLLIPARWVALYWRERLSPSNRRQLLLWSAAVAVALAVIFPCPRPLVAQPHQFKLISTGEKNRYSTGAVVEIRQIRTLDGKTIPRDQVHLSGDWQLVDDILISTRGGPASSVEINGQFAGGVVVSLRYLAEGGKAALDWDGQVQTVDLYTRSDSTINDFVLDGFTPATLLLAEWLLWVAGMGIYTLGLFVLVLALSLLIRVNPVRPTLGRILVLLGYLLILAVFIWAKFSYFEFLGNRPYRDSRSYVRNADQPITSINFWAGERSFTFPLELKLLGVHVADDWSNDAMKRVNLAQTWLSIASWGLLALLASLKVRQSWLRPLAFACILAFSLNLEIGVWDSTMLSESLSISFFALMVAGWMGWQLISSRKPPFWVQAALLAGLALVSVLYTFARDSNLFFLVLVAALFLGHFLLKRRACTLKVASFIYVGVLLLTALLQNLSISAGNRWQVFLYDHLAKRILVDPAARDFFVAHGLPITDKLVDNIRLEPFQYQDMITFDMDLNEVKKWIDSSGKQVYFLYLISDLGKSLREPLEQIPHLLDGSVLEYPFPIYASKPFSPLMMAITQFFYFRSAFFAWLAAIVLLGATVWWAIKGRHDSPWFVVGILALSVYPMMFIVWHGEPLEIDRHAIQIGIQFRLAAWMALIFILDQLTLRMFSPQDTMIAKG